jgi:hypothetical protein
LGLCHDLQVDVVAQWVRTWWTKQSRGGTEATRRNAAPVAFPLPEVTLPLVHEVTMNERDGFEPRSSARHDEPGRDGVQLREADGLLRVMLVSRQWHGVIRRRPPAVRLRRGAWLRWQINYRFASATGRGPWYYRLDTLNLAYGQVSADVFMGTPTHRIDERAQLR